MVVPSISILQYWDTDKLEELIQSLNITIDAKSTYDKQQLIGLAIDSCKVFEMDGLLQLVSTYGFLRYSGISLMPSPYDVYVSTQQIQAYSLAEGDWLKVLALKKGNKFTITRINQINRIPVAEKKRTIQFHSLSAAIPFQQIQLSGASNSHINRLLDIFVPQGFGQRTLLAAPPKSGKTHVLAAIGKGTSNYNNENVYTIVLMIAERPEEVAFFKQELPAALILSATFDQNSETQVRLAELANAHAQRMCEAGYDVILLVDSLTRLTRAYNDNSNSNKTMSGGLDPMALEKIKKFFGVGRRTNHGGSITIIGTCLTDTHSIMDDVILREMLGTSSSDLYLDKSIAERNLFPALDFSKSSTRNGYLLVGQEKYDNVCMIMRKINLAITKKTDIIALLKINLDKFPSNEEFINILSKA